MMFLGLSSEPGSTSTALNGYGRDGYLPQSYCLWKWQFGEDLEVGTIIIQIMIMKMGRDIYLHTTSDRGRKK